MRLCVDCKHHSTNANGFHLCGFKPIVVDPVTGIATLPSCGLRRNSSCGPEGKDYEPTLRARLAALFCRREFDRVLDRMKQQTRWEK